VAETNATISRTLLGDAPEVAGTHATLLVYGGNDQEGRAYELRDGGRLSFGRSRSADVRIDSELVSRIHAVFERDGLAVSVEDTGSRNGTLVNGKRIAGTQRLASGDEIIIGPCRVALTLVQPIVARPRIESTRYLEERLAAEVDRGRRYNRRVGLVMLRIDGPADVVDEAIDRIYAALRPMDSIAEYAPGIIAIVLPELASAALEQAARRLGGHARSRLGTPIAELAVSVGVAAYPDHGTTHGTLLARAISALHAAHSADDIGMPLAERDPQGEDIVVVDPQMARLYELVRTVAAHPITVLILGETGVGKEVVAAGIHAASQRSGKLVRLNCGSLPETLLESELFGHEKGAFTGADRRKQGFFEAAHGGTLFLDEIGEMTPALQSRLLRVLETRRITPVGSTEEIEVDVRVLCATHRDLVACVDANTFRQDLYFRISAFTLLVPPLRNRPSEIEPLARRFTQQCALAAGRKPPQLSPEVVSALCRYSWPGNVRELHNAIERAVVLQTAGVIRLEDLPETILDDRAVGTRPPASVLDHIQEQIVSHERAAIVAALDACGGNQTETAKRLGISRRTLIYRMEKHGLKPPPGARRMP
jgi:DNA-binding NtrC family response regulator/pSer/pThr/pTyr-binding forkhead associated (FHA) protein